MSFTGTLTSPKLMAPLQIDRGMSVSSLRALADDLARFLVVAQALVRRMAEAVVAGPLAELDVGDERGLDKRGPRQPRRVDERARVAAQRGQALGQVAQRALREAGAHVSGIAQIVVL